MHRTALLAAIVALSPLAANVALAHVGGWDWDEELQSRDWVPRTLGWAEDLHPTHPSWPTLEALVTPPPTELWCVYQTTPDQQDCSIHHALLLAWGEDFLGHPVTLQELDYPRACASSCYPPP